MTEEGNTATVASAKESTAETAKAAEAAKGSAPETTAARWKECLLPAQLAIPSHPSPI